MNTPHKHAEFIKAWADGAIIQWKSPSDDEWKTATRFANFSWCEHLEYRVKPELKDPGIVCRDAFYNAIYPDKYVPKSVQSIEWTTAARAVIAAYKAGELKDI